MVEISMFEKDNEIPLSMLRESFLDLSTFTGSYKNIRYKFEKDTSDGIKLMLYTWFEDISFEKVDKAKVNMYNFEYSKIGIKNGVNKIKELVGE